MAPSAIAQRRTHNLLLFQKLLNLRDGASPFTLLLDTLEQSSRPVVKEFMGRAKAAKSKIIFVSFQTLRMPKIVDIFIRAHGKALSELGQEIASHLPRPTTVSSPATSKTLMIIDSLNPLASTSSTSLPAFLSGLLSPTCSLLATYHTDVPIPSDPLAVYAPDPLTTLIYLATSILRISSISHVLEMKKARDRSLQEPGFGLDEGREGVIVGLESSIDGVVVEMEVRRKSGRGIREVFVLDTSTASTVASKAGGEICLLDDHALYRSPEAQGSGRSETQDGEEDPETTFSLGLTEKQRRDREGVVLPYFDAQKDEGGNEGGRILYEMSREDDWDDEEDEI